MMKFHCYDNRCLNANHCHIACSPITANNITICQIHTCQSVTSHGLNVMLATEWTGPSARDLPLANYSYTVLHGVINTFFFNFISVLGRYCNLGDIYIIGLRYH